MASSPIQQIINSVRLTGSAAALYTAPGGFTAQVMKLTVANSDTSAHTYTLYLVPSGGSATAATVITPLAGILPNATVNDPNIYGQVLNAGDAIWGLADAPSVLTVFASGLLSAAT